MRILVTGATGLIGKKLCQELIRRKHEIAIAARDPEKAAAKLKLPVMGFRWDALSGEPLPPLSLDRVDAIVHLAGEPIGDRYWTKAVKDRIQLSRVVGSASLAATLSERPEGQRPKAFIAASAIGFYGDRGDEELTERSKRGKGFLADTCVSWETASGHAGELCGRTAILRFGLVLSGDGGMLAKMIPPFRKGLGVVFGNGRNWMSWIHIQDLVRLICDAVEKPEYSGVINAVAPGPVSQSEFARELAHAFRRKARLKIPSLLLKLGLGGMSELMLGSQRVKPERAQALGFKFEYESLAQAMSDVTASACSAG
jgi:uncharacterized protein (TIGR01777 family)